MSYRTIFLFFLIFTIAAAFRFTGLNWDANAHLHPDERFLTMVATDISWPKSIVDYFDTKLSPLNPHNAGHTFYVYGTYPVHLVKLVSQIFHRDTYEGITIVGRAMSGIVDLVTMIFVFFIAKELTKSEARSTKFETNPKHEARNSKRFGSFGFWVWNIFRISDFGFRISPYIAMFLYGAMVFPIQQSHFFTVDSYATLFLTISLYLLIRGQFGVLLGIAVGLAISAKISSILIMPIVILAYIRAFVLKATSLPKQGVALRNYRVTVLFFILGFLCSFLLTLRIFYPYLFDGWVLNQLVLDNWKSLKSFDGVHTSFPPALQWIGVPVWKPTVDMIVWGLGIPLGIIATLAISYHVSRITYHAIRRNKTFFSQYSGVILLVLWVLLLIIYQSMQFAKAMRYFYPIYPAVAILTALCIVKCKHYLHSFSRHWIIGLLDYLTIGLLFIWPLAFVSIYMHPHTRIAASDWVYTNIPTEKTIAWEHWDDPLPLSRNKNHIGLYQTIQLPMYDPDSETKWKKLTQSLAETDYIILSSNRVYGGVAHAKDRYSITNRYYELLFSNQLGFEKVKEFTSRPTILGFAFIDDNAEESFTVYDHPKVTIIMNKERMSASELYSLITLH